ncbi:MAG: YjbQ family protein [Symbiobacteriia bacterium]
MSSWKADVTRFLQAQGNAGAGPVDLTDGVNEVVYQSEVLRGLCYLFTPNRDTGLALVHGSQAELPRAASFVSGLRNQITLSVVDRRLFLAPGQRVVLWEEDQPGQDEVPQRRRVMVRVVGEDREDRKDHKDREGPGEELPTVKAAIPATPAGEDSEPVTV